MFCSILIVHNFFYKDLFTDAKLDILFLRKAVPNFLDLSKYILKFYPHNFIICSVELINHFEKGKVNTWYKK